MTHIHTEGTPLFGGFPREAWPYHPEPTARASDPLVSHAAAASMRSAAHAQKLAIVEYLGRCAERGATACECDTALGWRSGSAGRRFKELRAVNLIVVSGMTRATDSGRQAEVMCLPMYAPPVRRV